VATTDLDTLTSLHKKLVAEREQSHARDAMYVDSIKTLNDIIAEANTEKEVITRTRIIERKQYEKNIKAVLAFTDAQLDSFFQHRYPAPSIRIEELNYSKPINNIIRERGEFPDEGIIPLSGFSTGIYVPATVAPADGSARPDTYRFSDDGVLLHPKAVGPGEEDIESPVGSEQVLPTTDQGEGCADNVFESGPSAGRSSIDLLGEYSQDIQTPEKWCSHRLWRSHSGCWYTYLCDIKTVDRPQRLRPGC
jgi:hypothetical protein